MTTPPPFELAVTESGTGRPVLLLHGGGGPLTVAPLAAHLAETAHVIAPTHPGFNGTERPTGIDSMRALADEYARYLEARELTDVLVVGSSIGGWLAAELALGSAADRISGLVLINAVGIDVAGNPIRNISGLPPQQLAQYSFHDPSRLKLPPLPPRASPSRRPMPQRSTRSRASRICTTRPCSAASARCTPRPS